MHEGGLLTQNFDILVYGPLKEKFVEFANINDEYTINYTTKKVQPKNSRPEPSNTTNPQPAKTDELSKLQASYYSKINKMQGLPDENKPTSPTKETSLKAADSEESGPFYFTWGDLNPFSW